MTNYVIIWLTKLSILSVPDEGYSRNASCALNLIVGIVSTMLLFLVLELYQQCFCFLFWNCIDNAFVFCFANTFLRKHVSMTRSTCHAFISPSCSLREKSSLPVFCKCGEPCTIILKTELNVELFWDLQNETMKIKLN